MNPANEEPNQSKNFGNEVDMVSAASTRDSMSEK